VPLLLGTPLLLFLAGCSGLAYFPSKELYSEPKAAMGLAYEDVFFTSSDGTRLGGWFFPARVEAGKWPLGTVLQFHGNAENRSTHYSSLAWVVSAGYNFFAFDYRGYGNSEGAPDQAGVYRDGLAAIDYVQRKVPAVAGERDVILFGQSLGTGVLARDYQDVTDRSRILSVVMEAPFTSYKAMAREFLSRSFVTWLLQPLGSLLVSDAYSPEHSYAKISPTPLLVVHGDQDQVVPFHQGELVFAGAHEPKMFWRVAGARHLQAFDVNHGEYRRKILAYWDGLRRLRLEDRRGSGPR
jgi:fermentation-respiration switch protein FrsA (DUF1100 family)